MPIQESQEDTLLTNYNFELPPAQIAQFPPEKRGGSRLLVMRRGPEEDFPPTCVHTHFSHLPEHLPDNALLVANNSRVLAARIYGRLPTGGRLEFLLLTPLPLILANASADQKTGYFHAEALGLTRSSKRLRCGDHFTLGERLSVSILECGEFGRKKVLLSWSGDLEEIFAKIGHIPLPPYIRREDSLRDKERYQTVYARSDKTGSVAAPTAGLHFTQEMRESLLSLGFQWAEVTLYVGYGTFSPVRCEDIRRHTMHSEYIEISEEAAMMLSEAKALGRPIIAIGTTSLRALEGMIRACSGIQPFSGYTDIFLYPGEKIRLVDGLLTNFHLPESSLIMLVAALAGRRRILAAYEEAIRKGYRFFSYGDAMLILPEA